MEKMGVQYEKVKICLNLIKDPSPRKDLSLKECFC